MGTVHGVYLKYVGLSALSYASYALLVDRDETTGERWTMLHATSRALRMTTTSAPTSGTAGGLYSAARHGLAAIMGYSAILNGVIAVLFKAEVGMGLIGKDRTTGRIPMWSRILWFPFHIPTRIYTYFHTRAHEPHVPVASQVQPGWWVGGCYGHELKQTVPRWAAVIDLTVEFPETAATDHYLSIPTWDGVPATPAQLDQGATFAVQHIHQSLPILVHCAHGRGRSTTMMCACLVKAGLYDNWQDAFSKGIQPGRPVCKLNRRMKQALTAWQAEYVDGKKGQ